MIALADFTAANFNKLFRSKNRPPSVLPNQSWHKIWPSDGRRGRRRRWRSSSGPQLSGEEQLRVHNYLRKGSSTSLPLSPSNLSNCSVANESNHSYEVCYIREVR